MDNLRLSPDQISAFKRQLDAELGKEKTRVEAEIGAELALAEKNRLRGTRAHRWIFTVLVIVLINLGLNGMGLFKADTISNTVEVVNRKATATHVKIKHLKTSVNMPHTIDSVAPVKQTECTYTLTTNRETGTFRLRSQCPD
jgi:hypothetical protein